MSCRLLDLFCGAGGAGMGYHRAGFDLIGVDIEPQPRYPFAFHQADALEFVAEHGHEFDAIHASPPCQAYSLSRNNGAARPSPRLIPIVRTALTATGKPFIIENVPGAPLLFAVTLCGASFGLGVDGFDLPRHRRFESNILFLVPPCIHRRGRTVGVYGNGTNSWHRQKFGRNLSAAMLREAMGIDWMSRGELSQAIPPAYTEYLGNQLVRILEASQEPKP